jgi:hypothetical protein
MSVLLPTGAANTVVRFVYDTVNSAGTYPAAGWFIDDFVVMDRCTATPAYSVTSSDNCPSWVTAQIAGYGNGQAHPVGTTANSWSVRDASGNTASCWFRVNVRAFVPLEPRLNAELMMYAPARVRWSSTGVNGAVDVYLRNPISKAKIMDIVLNYLDANNEYFFHPQKLVPGSYEIVVTPTGQAGGIGVVITVVLPNV